MYVSNGPHLFLFVLAELSDEQKEFQTLVRKFSREEILPKAAYHDKTGEVGMLLLYGAFAVPPLLFCFVVSVRHKNLTSYL